MILIQFAHKCGLWSVSDFFLLLSKTKIFFAEFWVRVCGCRCLNDVFLMSWFFGRRIDSNFSFRVYHSLLRFLFLVFAKEKRQEAGHVFKLLDQTWTMIIVARAFGGQHYYVIMILILARSYIKRRVVVVVVYAYFLGEISQVDTFSLEHVTGLQ